MKYFKQKFYNILESFAIDLSSRENCHRSGEKYCQVYFDHQRGNNFHPYSVFVTMSTGIDKTKYTALISYGQSRYTNKVIEFIRYKMVEPCELFFKNFNFLRI